MFEPHTPDELAGFTKPASVDGCLVEYYYVESTQAAIQVTQFFSTSLARGFCDFFG